MSTRRAAPAFLLLAAACTGDEDRPLDAAFLLGTGDYARPVSSAAYAPAGHSPTANRFEGTLVLRPGIPGGMAVQVDWFGFAQQPELRIGAIPGDRFEIVQSGNELLPLEVAPGPNAHPHWELSLGAGGAWDEPGDGGWTRAALPFALLERNANCTHNGLLTFLFRENGKISRVAYQVASETCQYFQADLWGTLEADYRPGPLEDAEAAIAARERTLHERLPVRPLAAIEHDFPGARPARFDWFPDGEVTTLGFVIDGIHYRGDCPTRHGPYPFCEELVLPSYSLAKSIFAGLAWMMLEQRHPGVGEARVTDHVPACGDPRWDGVTLEHLLDMASGNFESLEPEVDEYSSYDTDFMGGDTHALKIATACALFPRKAPPGSAFAYHTSDTYIAGTVMNAILAGQADDGDIHRDLLHRDLFEPMGLSPVTGFSRRTYDTAAQPFTGYGLYLLPDDIARIGRFLAEGTGRIGGEQRLHPGLLAAALQRDPNDPGLRAGGDKLRYNNGFWAYGLEPGNGCKGVAWIPFLSGYGGISVAIMPNDSIFYVFSDKGRFEWLEAADASHSIRSFCH